MTSATVTVAAEEAGQRLDAFLAARLGELSRARVQALIRGGHVRAAAGVIAEAARRVKSGEVFAVAMPPPVAAAPEAEPTPLQVLFEDDHLIVVVKPAGMVVHPAPGHQQGTLVNALLAHCAGSLSGIGGVRRPGIVHRLDREVSGVLVAAKHDRAHLGLAAQFTLHSIRRIYEAVVWGLPSPVRGVVDRPLGRDPNHRLRMAVVQDGKPAITEYQLLAAAGIRASRLELRLRTGRTHQIRVHLADRGHPILGDRLYGRRPPAVPREVATLDRIALHAREIGFVHPVTGEHLTFVSAPPELFDRLLDLLKT